jgi:hypothetical protein
MRGAWDRVRALVTPWSGFLTGTVGCLSSAGVVRSWSVVSSHSTGALVMANRRECQFCLTSRIWLMHPSVER